MSLTMHTLPAGVFTVLIGVTHENFGACMAMVILAGIFLEAGCGATYGVVPFVSRRSTGIVCGLVSAGGACGGVINQALFFLNTPAKGAYGERAPHCQINFCFSIAPSCPGSIACARA